ncbi:MAG: hypothetical protein AAF957_10235, partial [Planctomycetota bacterium]
GYRLESVVGPTLCYDDGTLDNCSFGGRLDLSGGTLVVLGAGPSLANLGSFGLVHVVERVGDAWETVQIIRPIPNTQPTTSFFGTALSIDGDTLAIGAPGFRVASTGQVGAVFLYDRGPSGWHLSEMLQAPPPTAVGERRFGEHLDLAGDLLVVGEPSGGGRAHAFERRGGAWSLVQTFERPGGGDAFTAFGSPVAIDRDTQSIVIAEHYSTNALLIQGVIWIHERDPASGVWSLAATFGPTETSGSSLINTNFGASVDIEGETVLVGSPGQRVQGVRMGAIEVIRRGPQGWSKVGRLAPPLPHAATPTLGFACALVDGRAVIGDRFWAPNSTTWRGRAYLWEFSRGAEICAGSNGAVTLNLLFDAGSDVDLTASVFGLQGRGIGYFVAGQPSAGSPFGAGELCVGAPRRISAPQLYGYGQSVIYAQLQHPNPSAPTSTAFQFVYSRRDGVFPAGASIARVVD